MTIVSPKKQNSQLNFSDTLKVSVHGGHSGEFCCHAKDSLEGIILAYIEQGYAWVGITEHMPPTNDDFLYPDEVDAKLDSQKIKQRFSSYFQECKRLKQKYKNQIEIMICFETEAYEGADNFIKALIKQTQPDYIVGSVHHVSGIGIDFDETMYQQAINACGSIEQLYCNYFDTQYDLLVDLKPAVVGHFDLIRIFDKDYLERLTLPPIWQRVERNLEFIANNDLILDFNLRGFDKTTEQYPCTPILKKALSLGINVVPGDDSHGVSSVGRNYDKGVEILQSLGDEMGVELGINGEWPKPKCMDWTGDKTKAEAME